MLYQSWKSVPPDILTSIDILPRKSGKRVGKNKRKYLNIVSAFDIETTALNEQYSIMYIWQMQIGRDVTVIGRSWKEFDRLIRKITAGLDEGIYLVCYVHNLGYEHAYLGGYYRFDREDVFAVESHTVLRADICEHVEFRCSYLHSNMSLDAYLKKLGVESQKLDYDYKKPRYPWTPLSDDELAYCINDVKGLVEGIYTEMAMDGDTLYTIPATSTGYVRRDVKLAMRPLRKYVQSIVPDFETYTLLREAFRGGNTHASRYMAGTIIEHVHSIDIASAYPASQLMDDYPIRAFSRVKDLSINNVDRLINVRRKALLMQIAMEGVRLTDKYDDLPYLSDSKCRRLSGARLDNGRILSADYLETTVTDLDYAIIKDQYTCDDIRVLYAESSSYGPLPEPLKSLIMYYYRQKTELKGVPESLYYYGKSKEKLNAIYGMSAQNPVRDNVIYVNGEYEYEGRDLEELLEESNRHAYFAYQWGVWTTAHVRSKLHQAYRELQRQGAQFVYCDTDSLKYTGDVDLDTINRRILERAQAGGYYADDRHGKRHYIGIFEYEGSYPKFATRGAKKYAYTYDRDGVEHVRAVIAGVPTREDHGHISGGMILDRMGGIEVFLEPVVRFANKSKIIYNKRDTFLSRIDGHRIKVRPCATISDTEYTLADTLEYSDLVHVSKAELHHFARDILGKKYF